MQPPSNLCMDPDELNFETPPGRDDSDSYNPTYQPNTSMTQFYQIYSDSDNDCSTSTLNKRLRYKKLQKTIRKRRNRAVKSISSKQINNQINYKDSSDESNILQATGMYENLINNGSPQLSGLDLDESNEFLLTNEREEPEVLIQYIKILLKDAVQKEQKIKELQEEFDRRKNEINNLNAIYDKLKKKK